MSKKTPAKGSLNIPPVVSGDYEFVPPDGLKLHPRNVRRADFGAIYESIRANGFFGACVAQRSTRHVLIGNHRAAAAKELRIPAVPVIWVDCSDEEALRIMVADNRVGDLANDDTAALAALLSDLAATDLGLDGIGFNLDDLDSMLNDLVSPLDLSGAGGKGGEASQTGKSGDKGDGEGKQAREPTPPAPGEKSLNLLGTKVPVTDDEASDLALALRDYKDEHGTHAGFVSHLLGL